MNIKQLIDTSKIAARALWAYPGRTLMIAGLFVIASLAEGLGVASALPLLGLFDDAASETSPISLAVKSVTNAFGLEPTLVVLLTLIAAGITIKAALTFLAMTQLGFATAAIAADLRKELLDALLKARWSFFVHEPIGILGNAFGMEANNAASLVGYIARMFALVVQITMYLTLAFFVSWQVTIAAIVAGVLIFVLLDWLVEMARQASRTGVISMRVLMSHLVDSLQGIKPLKAMALEDRIAPILEKEIGVLNSASRSMVIAKEAMGNIQEPLLVILLCSGFFVVLTYTTLPFNTVLMMGLLFYRAAGRFGELQTSYQSIATCREYFVRLEEKTLEAISAQEPHIGKKTQHFSKSIRLENVEFSYGNETILNEISIEVAAGSFTAILGPSGSGKTTAADLILGFLTPDSGRVSVDGVDLNEVDMHKWRTEIGYVPQELFLFHDTILQNITLGHPSISREDAERAIRDAGVGDFVASLPDGIHTAVGERGLRLSGGQRQRIAIARALVRSPRLLVLDEPTTALDPKTEREICQTLASLKGRVTILAISHQRAIADIADRVYELVGGTVRSGSAQDASPAFSSANPSV